MTRDIRPVTQSQLATVQEAPAAVEEAQGLQALVDELAADDAAAWKFLTAFAMAEKIAKPLKTKLKESLNGRESIYFKRQLRAGKRVVNPLDLSHYMGRLGFDIVLQACPQFPLAKVQEMFDLKMGGQKVPDAIITTAGGSEALTLTPANKLITTNRS